MAEVTILSQIEKVRSFEKGYQAVQVINTGFRFGLLNAIAESPEGLTVYELAVKLMLHEPFLKIWCQTAYHFEILDCNQFGRFSLQPFLEDVIGVGLLADDSQKFADNRIDKYPQKDEDSAWVQFIRIGRIIHTVRTPEASFATRRATLSMITIFRSMIFPYNNDLKRRLEQGVNYLDIGCGSASLIIEFSHIFQRNRYIGIDPDVYAIDHAEKAISELGLEDRVGVENCSAEEMNFNEEFDMVGMVLTLHEIQPNVRLEALTKTYQALKKGGLLMILDYPYPARLEDFRNSRYDYGIMEQYFEAPNGVVHISEKEQNELLCKAGFKEISRMPVSTGGMLDFITAVKE